jgi:hypothetical protein
MEPDTSGLYYYMVGSAVTIIVRPAGVCGGCGKPRFNFVNREGQTLCMICDYLRQPERQQPAAEALPDGTRCA